MKIYKIALVVRKYPPAVYEATNKVVEENKTINDMADFYRVNRDVLAYVVMKLRRMKTFSVDTINKIVELFKSAKSKKGRGTSQIQKKLSKLYNLNIEKEDITFILKEKGLTNTLPKTELEETLSLLDKGKGSLEISEIVQINISTINYIKEKYRPELIQRRERTNEETKEIYNRYLYLVNVEEKTHKEASKITIKEFNLKDKELIKILYKKGIRVGTPLKRLTEEEINKILQLLREGISINQIGRELGKPVSTIYLFLKTKYPELLKKRNEERNILFCKDIGTDLIKSVLLSINKKETLEVIQNKLNISRDNYYFIKNNFQDNFKEFIIKSIEKDDDTNKIIENISEIYGMDISINSINRIIRENFPDKPLRTEEISKKTTQEEDWTKPTWKDPKKIQQDIVEIPSFTGETLKMTKQEYDEQVRQMQQLTEQSRKRQEESKKQQEQSQTNLDIEEDFDAMIRRIEQRQREKEEKNPVASSLNWYKKAKLLNFKNI